MISGSSSGCTPPCSADPNVKRTVLSAGAGGAMVCNNFSKAFSRSRLSGVSIMRKSAYIIIGGGPSDSDKSCCVSPGCSLDHVLRSLKFYTHITVAGFDRLARR